MEHMKHRTKIIAGVLVATLALAGVLVGTISADEGDVDGARGSLMARVAEILGLEQDEVESAFQQAMQEQRDERQAQMEAARDARLQDLIDKGVVTEEQVAEWKAWLESRPDNRDAMREWIESRPDMGDAFRAGGLGDRDAMADRFGERPTMPRGPMGGMPGFPGGYPTSGTAA
jgi:hypothetical protein